MTPGIVVDGGWHTYAITQGISTAINFFYDGKAIGGAAGYSGYAASFTGQRALMGNDDGSNPMYGPMSWLAVWSRALTNPEHQAIANDPWQLFGPSRVTAAIPRSIVQGFSVSAPAVLYANNPSIALSLLGFGTSWGSGTTFTVSGVSGTTKSSQSVTDGTHATVTVATGSTTGTLTISDGTASATFLVSPQSIAAAPFNLPANHSGHIAIALTGSGTTWNGGTTFGIAGVSGTSKVSQSVTSATSATLTITTGSGTGTLTVTDGTNSTPVASPTPPCRPPRIPSPPPD